MSQRRPFRLLFVLSALAAGSLACATLGGSTGPNDFPPAPPTSTSAPEDDYKPTDAPEATEEPPADATEPVDVAPTEDTGGGDTGGSDFCSTAPADVPLMDVTTTFTYCDATTLSFQTGDASYDDVLKFYKDGLEAAGWSVDTSLGGSVETTDAAVLYYVKDGRHIAVTVSYSSTEKLTSLQVIVMP